MDGEEQQAALERHRQVQMPNTVHLPLKKGDARPHSKLEISITWISRLNEVAVSGLKFLFLTYSAGRTACLVHVSTAVRAQRDSLLRRKRFPGWASRTHYLQFYVKLPSMPRVRFSVPGARALYLGERCVRGLTCCWAPRRERVHGSFRESKRAGCRRSCKRKHALQR